MCFIVKVHTWSCSYAVYDLCIRSMLGICIVCEGARFLCYST